MSDPFTVIVKDPCLDTEITPQSIEDVIIDIDDQFTIMLEEFTDSVSLAHYHPNKCG